MAPYVGFCQAGAQMSTAGFARRGQLVSGASSGDSGEQPPNTAWIPDTAGDRRPQRAPCICCIPHIRVTSVTLAIAGAGPRHGKGDECAGGGRARRLGGPQHRVCGVLRGRVHSLCAGNPHSTCSSPRRSQLQALEKAIAQVDRVGSEAHELSKANQATVLSVESTLAAVQEVGASLGERLGDRIDPASLV